MAFLPFSTFAPFPCLEKLFIQFPSNLNQQYDISDLEPLDVVFQNLKWIKIANFDGSPHEQKLVKFLLEKATVLESIFLFMNQCDISNNSSSLRTVQEQLSSLPKASKDAQIVICGPLDRDLYDESNTHNLLQSREVLIMQPLIGVENIPLNQEFL